MSIVVTQSIVLTGDEADLTADHPIVGWDNIVTVDTMAADTAATGYPATNLASPATHEYWKANDTTTQYLTVTTGSADDVDYVGIARHNLSSEAIAVSIEGNSGSGWVEQVAPAILPNDGPALFRFTPAPFTGVRIKLASGDAAAQIAVVFVGKLLVLPRKLYQGFTQPSHGRMGKEVNAMAESGDYLGTIVTQQRVESKIPLSLVDPTYYRDHIDPFIAERPPFFIGWRPQSYPREIGYMRLTNWPQAAPQSPHSLLALSLEMTGVV